MRLKERDHMARDSDYKKELSWLYGLQKYGIKFGLSKTSNLLEAFGNPHHGQKYIHIAGTNGKGSVGAMLESILMKSGYRVGFYSSPHLANFTERFRVNRKFMGQDDASLLIKGLRKVSNKKEPPTFFELTTAMALTHFYKHKTDFAIMEVGMGGRLDATNIITPMVSIITNIGLDHKGFLGNTIIDIAREKGGIIKRNIDVVTAATQPYVIKLFESICRQHSAPFWRVGKDVRYKRLPGGLFAYYGIRDRFSNLKIGIKGRFQYRNAALAMLALEILKSKGIAIPNEAIELGINDIMWPGRVEQVSSDPFIILDGAHNPNAMSSLSRSIRDDFKYDKLILIIGIMADKDISNIIKKIIPMASIVIFTKPDYYRAEDPYRLMETAKKFNKPGEVHFPVSSAIERAKKLAGKRDLILITGSLFTVGEAESYFDPLNYPPGDI
ncbi:MAG: bifunctional folylpolyglutamate synthase/dihydrofolate synthase [Deltaproteobacteria bacterium]|nr:bifunctional folylpolyglutamate synthase/dihydrofolate synthase [Deltaproteobacteria bacterium]